MLYKNGVGYLSTCEIAEITAGYRFHDCPANDKPNPHLLISAMDTLRRALQLDCATGRLKAPRLPFGEDVTRADFRHCAGARRSAIGHARCNRARERRVEDEQRTTEKEQLIR